MKLTSRMIPVLLSLLMGVTEGGAQIPLVAFEQGNALYREGKFEEAVEAYESILRQGWGSPELYFNLGNAYYRLGRTARAILSYERALRLAPNDQDIKHNLALANLRTVDRIEALPELFFVQWLRSLSAFLPLHVTVQIFVVCWALLFGSLAVFYFVSHDGLLRFMRVLALVSALALIPVAGLLTAQYLEAQSRNDAIITAGVVTAKTSPDEQSVDAFVIHEGLKVSLGDMVGEWVRITLADGKVGWIRIGECERI
jgi:tetratricopeptide (TPR) repeat protein